MQPFLDHAEKGIYILCRTSNPGGSDFQNLVLESGKKVYEQVAYLAVNDWNVNNNIGLVVGATRPEEISDIRKITGEMSFLLPGVGVQGADIESLVEKGKGGGMIINSSRAIIYASDRSDFASEARLVAEETRTMINRFC